MPPQKNRRPGQQPIEVEYKLVCPKTNWIKIVHLDDHRIFREAFSRVIFSHLKNVILVSFENCYEALVYIEKCGKDKDKINLVVTDFNHPGINGYEFSKFVKLISKDHSCIPVLMLTMQDYYMSNVISNACHENIIDMFLPKTASAKEILSYIQTL